MVASSERLHHGAATEPLSIVRNVAVGERLSDYRFREATELDLRCIEALFEPRGIAPGWAAWKYFENPDGIARICVAEDPNQKIVGMLAHIPRKFNTADNDTITALQVVDVYIVPELRDRGVFLGLLDFARTVINGPRFGVPNQYSANFGLQVDWEILGPFERWHFPVALGNRLAGTPVSFLAPLANGLCRAYRTAFLPLVRAGIEMKRIRRFDRSFELDTNSGHGVRSADYLNWRFIDNPKGRNYCVYEFFDNGESVGYCVLFRTGANAMLSDLVTTRHKRACLRLLVDHCQDDGIALLGIRGTGLALGKLGFIRRASKLNCTAVELPGKHWIVMSCDIDADC